MNINATNGYRLHISRFEYSKYFLIPSVNHDSVIRNWSDSDLETKEDIGVIDVGFTVKEEFGSTSMGQCE